MIQASLYGEFQSEKLANESQVAREIVKEINNFGINERQRWLIIHSLALELEDQNDMRELVGFIKELKEDSLFLSTIKEG